MQINHLKINDIPLLTCCSDKKQHKKLVVIYYGAYMKKELVLNFSFVKELTDRGYMLVLPEIPMHGERRNSILYEPERDRINISVQAGKELSIVLNQLGYSEMPCAVIGGSLGGLCALFAAVMNNNIKNIACYCTPLFMLDFKNGIVGKKENELLTLKSANKIELLASKNMLIMAGEYDRWAKPEIIKKEVEKIKAKGGSIVYKTIAGCGHELTKEMESTIVQWIQKNH